MAILRLDDDKVVSAALNICIGRSTSGLAGVIHAITVGVAATGHVFLLCLACLGQAVAAVSAAELLPSTMAILRLDDDKVVPAALNICIGRSPSGLAGVVHAITVGVAATSHIFLLCYGCLGQTVARVSAAELLISTMAILRLYDDKVVPATL